MKLATISPVVISITGLLKLSMKKGLAGSSSVTKNVLFSMVARVLMYFKVLKSLSPRFILKIYPSGESVVESDKV